MDASGNCSRIQGNHICVKRGCRFEHSATCYQIIVQICKTMIFLQCTWNARIECRLCIPSLLLLLWISCCANLPPQQHTDDYKKSMDIFVLHNFLSFLGFAMQLEKEHDTQKQQFDCMLTTFFINGHCVFYTVFKIISSTILLRLTQN